MTPKEKALYLLCAAYGLWALYEQHEKHKARSQLRELQGALIVKAVIESTNIKKPRAWRQLWRTN